MRVDQVKVNEKYSSIVKPLSELWWVVVFHKGLLVELFFLLFMLTILMEVLAKISKFPDNIKLSKIIIMKQDVLAL